MFQPLEASEEEMPGRAPRLSRTGMKGNERQQTVRVSRLAGLVSKRLPYLILKKLTLQIVEQNLLDSRRKRLLSRVTNVASNNKTHSADGK